MASIRPFRGVRFHSARSGPLGPLLAPPYDVASASNHVAEFSISGIENADLGIAGDQHAEAARRYRGWLADAILRPDSVPAYYVHRHQFLSHGTPLTRIGLLARVRLHDWQDRIVLPHEKTNRGPREERLGRLRAVKANLSPLYFLYRDAGGEVRTLIDDAVRRQEARPAIDRMGGVHQLYRLEDQATHAALESLFSDRSLFVADGHHRYEAALSYRDEMRRRYPGVSGPWEYVLALLSAVEDPGVVVRPTHRLLMGGPDLPGPRLVPLLRRWFRLAPAAGEEREIFRLVVRDDATAWSGSALPGNPHTALMADGPGAAWRGLDVSAIEGALTSAIGGGADARERRVQPVVDEHAAVEQVRAGRAHAAFLLPAPTLDRLLAVAEGGDLLPPKSTWFEPKAPAGLVINDFALSAE